MKVRLGMLTPSSNTVLEPMCAAMAAALPDTSVHFSRFTVTRIAMDDSALGQFNTGPMVEAAKLLADAKVDVIAWNGTSASWLGLASDHALVREIEAETGDEASDLFFSLGKHELIKRSEILPDKNKHELRFVTTEFIDVHTGDEWEDCWKHIC